MKNTCLTLVALASWAGTIWMAARFVISGIRSVMQLEVFQDSLLFSLLGMILLSWFVTGPRALVCIRRMARATQKAVANLAHEVRSFSRQYRVVGNRPPFYSRPFNRPRVSRNYETQY